MNAPLVLGLLVKEYGRALFGDDQPLHLYLYLVTATLSLRQLPSQSRDRILFLGRAYEELQLKLQVDADF